MKNLCLQDCWLAVTLDPAGHRIMRCVRMIVQSVSDFMSGFVSGCVQSCPVCPIYPDTVRYCPILSNAVR